MSTDERYYIVYDGDCPFCSRYVKLLRLRDALGMVELVDARRDHPIVRLLAAKHVDLDQGMALVIGDQISVGAECIHQLALLTTPVNLFNRMNAMVFRSRRASRLIYPLLRAGRNLLLRLLGRAKLGQRGADGRNSGVP